MEMIQAILPVIVVLAIGMLFRIKNVISSEGIDGLQALIMNFCLPVVLFSNFYRTPISVDTLLFPATLYFATVAGIFVGRFLCKIAKQTDHYLPFMLSGYEAGLIGYALFGILVGSNITNFAMMDMGHGLAIFTAYLAIFKASEGEKQPLKAAVMGILKAPVLIGIILGFLMGITGLGKVLDESAVGPIIANLCSFIAAPTSAVILVVIGYRMNFRSISWRDIGTAIFLRVIEQLIWCGVILGFFALLGGDFASSITTLSVVMFMMLPPPYIIPLYVKTRKAQEFYSSAISAYTMLTIVGFIILAGVVLL